MTPHPDKNPKFDKYDKYDYIRVPLEATTNAHFRMLLEEGIHHHDLIRLAQTLQASIHRALVDSSNKWLADTTGKPPEPPPFGSSINPFSEN